MPLYNPQSSWSGPQFPYFGASTVYQGPLFGNASTLALTANRLYMVPVYLQANRTYTSLAIGVGTGVAASTAYLGLYNSRTSDGQPTTLAAGNGSANATATNSTTVTETISFTPSQSGWYWLATLPSGAITVAAMGTIGCAGAGLRLNAGSGTLVVGIHRAFGSAGPLSSDETAGSFTTSDIIGSYPIIGIR